MRTVQDIFEEVKKEISDAKLSEPPAGDKNIDPSRLVERPEHIGVATTVLRKAWRGSHEHPEIEEEVLAIQQNEIELNKLSTQLKVDEDSDIKIVVEE